ncbi:hypothetical protein [Arthrobacter sp. ES1]|uniref:hypothetical protein n=1 Tax=Arthrobacter sp. ES1 TaxID=1897056 RepID=UPI001CFFF6A3|nr:hypothetical protein [Arthrobacter sp. ES1]MCB5280555.1 hypothetical protein [Arthrobacter sp. ES1]
MPNYQVNATQLTPNTTVHIKGKLTYSRLAKLVEGTDLARVDQQRIQNGMQPIGRPHTSVNLAEAEVQFLDPANPTKEEIFVQERRFASAKHPEHGQSYSMDNKSTNLPIVAVQNAAGEAEQIVLEGDLAAGLEVTLVLRVYKPKGFPNCGLSLDLVLLHEQPRYYNAGVNTGELAARGIIFATPPVKVSGADAAAAAPAAAYAAAGLPANTDAATGLPAPAPAVAAVVATPPVMQPAPVAAAPVAQPQETLEQEVARLRAESAARNAASAASGGESAFGSPWEAPKEPAAQGIAYSG